MRLLYLTHNVTWKGGGVFFTAYHQGRHLVQRGHEVVLLSISPDHRRGFHEHVSNGVRIIETPDLLSGRGRSGWDPSDVLRRIGFLRGQDFDLIHGFESRPVVAIPGLYLRQARRIPLVLTWADWFGRGGKGTERGRGLSLVMGPLENWCEEYFYPRADWIIAMGAPLVETCHSGGCARRSHPEPAAWLRSQGDSTHDGAGGAQPSWVDCRWTVMSSGTWVCSDRAALSCSSLPSRSFDDGCLAPASWCWSATTS